MQDRSLLLFQYYHFNLTVSNPLITYILEDSQEVKQLFQNIELGKYLATLKGRKEVKFTQQRDDLVLIKYFSTFFRKYNQRPVTPCSWERGFEIIDSYRWRSCSSLACNSLVKNWRGVPMFFIPYSFSKFEVLFGTFNSWCRIRTDTV